MFAVLERLKKPSKPDCSEKPACAEVSEDEAAQLQISIS
jgi:hypothetical protein